MRTIPGMHEHMLKVDEKIENVVLPSLLVEEVTKKGKPLYSLQLLYTIFLRSANMIIMLQKRF